MLNQIGMNIPSKMMGKAPGEGEGMKSDAKLSKEFDQAMNLFEEMGSSLDSFMDQQNQAQALESMVPKQEIELAKKAPVMKDGSAFAGPQKEQMMLLKNLGSKADVMVEAPKLELNQKMMPKTPVQENILSKNQNVMEQIGNKLNLAQMEAQAETPQLTEKTMRLIQEAVKTESTARSKKSMDPMNGLAAQSQEMPRQAQSMAPQKAETKKKGAIELKIGDIPFQTNGLKAGLKPQATDRMDQQMAALNVKSVEVDTKSKSKSSKSSGEQISAKSEAPQKRMLSADQFLNMRNQIKKPQAAEQSQVKARPVQELKTAMTDKSIMPEQKIEGGKEEVQTMKLDQASANVQSPSLPTSVFKSQVIQGADARDRLSSDALNQVTEQIGQFKVKGGGEIKMKLQPEHLGDLVVKVSTVGNQVDLNIQATEGTAKQVLESSLTALKEKLEGQNLVLSKVDVALGGQTSTVHQSSSSSEHFAQGGQNFDQNLERNFNQSQQESSRERFENKGSDEPVLSRSGLKHERANPPVRSATLSGRLDIRA